MSITEEQLKKDLVQGGNNNVLVYDNDSNGVLTNRLLSLMQTIMNETYKQKIVKFIIHEKSKYTDIIDDRFKNVEFEYVEDMMEDYFLSPPNNFSLAKKHKNIVLSYGKKGQIILGSY